MKTLRPSPSSHSAFTFTCTLTCALALILTASLVGFSPSSWAASDDYESFDSIVRGLSRGSSRVASPRPQDPMEQVQFHGGVALITTLVQVREEVDRAYTSGLLKGVEASLGIDLFTPRWVAEGALRSFTSDKLDPGVYASLKEFDLKFVHRIPRSLNSHYRFGSGLSARYLDLTFRSPEQETVKDFNTPAALVFLGGHGVISRHLSAGFEVSYRLPLVSDTADLGGLSASLRLDSQF